MRHRHGASPVCRLRPDARREALPEKVDEIYLAGYLSPRAEVESRQIFGLPDERLLYPEERRESGHCWTSRSGQ